MTELRVEITRFVDEEPQPGIVVAQFRDADGRVHTIQDKVPLFTAAMLWSDSEYPQPGTAECQVLERFERSDGRALARIALAWVIELADDTAFVVDVAELTADDER
jgi:hypothetical protein